MGGYEESVDEERSEQEAPGAAKGVRHGAMEVEAKEPRRKNEADPRERRRTRRKTGPNRYRTRWQRVAGTRRALQNEAGTKRLRRNDGYAGI
jgi:hypothetical protein